jgi:hypothetical protein
MAESQSQMKWVRKFGFVSEFDIDARWVMYEDGNPKPQGSLRIVSFPNLPPGHLKSFCSIVIKRKPKTKKEIEDTKIKKINDGARIESVEVFNNEELELYSIDEHIETWDTTDVAPSYKLEKTYGVKIFN